MKYHSPLSVILISLAVLLVFVSVALFAVFSLGMTSPTLIITEKLLEEIAAADSDLSLSFGSIDRSFRDGITIRDIEVSYKDEDIASFQTLRIHMGLFSLIKYLASSDGNLAIEGYDGCINIPDALALSRGDGGSSALLDVISRYAFSIHLHDFSISLPHGISAENAEVEYEESRLIMDGSYGEKEQNEISQKRADLLEERNNLVKSFIQDNYNNALGPGIFILIGNNMPFPFLTPVMEEIVDKAPDSFKNNPMIKDYITAARSNMEKIRAMN